MKALLISFAVLAGVNIFSTVILFSVGAIKGALFTLFLAVSFLVAIPFYKKIFARKH